MSRVFHDTTKAYCVVHFLEWPYDEIGKYVIVPNSWIQIRSLTDHKVIIRYPVEDSFITRMLVVCKQMYLEEWNTYVGIAEYYADCYYEAEQWIQKTNNLLTPDFEPYTTTEDEGTQYFQRMDKPSIFESQLTAEQTILDTSKQSYNSSRWIDGEKYSPQHQYPKLHKSSVPVVIVEDDDTSYNEPIHIDNYSFVDSRPSPEQTPLHTSSSYKRCSSFEYEPRETISLAELDKIIERKGPQHLFEIRPVTAEKATPVISPYQSAESYTSSQRQSSSLKTLQTQHIGTERCKEIKNDSRKVLSRSIAFPTPNLSILNKYENNTRKLSDSSRPLNHSRKCSFQTIPQPLEPKIEIYFDKNNVPNINIQNATNASQNFLMQPTPYDSQNFLIQPTSESTQKNQFSRTYENNYHYHTPGSPKRMNNQSVKTDTPVKRFKRSGNDTSLAGGNQTISKESNMDHELNNIINELVYEYEKKQRLNENAFSSNDITAKNTETRYLNSVKVEASTDDDTVNYGPRSNLNCNHLISRPAENGPNNSKWTLKYRHSAPGLVELIPHIQIYVNAAQLENITRSAHDCKNLARMLLTEIFSEEALSLCTLRGNRYGDDPRPGLDKKGRDVLFIFVKLHAYLNNWEIINDTNISSILYSKIYHIRCKNKK